MRNTACLGTTLYWAACLGMMFVLPTQASAQEVITFSELEAAGAQRMTNDEIKDVLTGALFTGKMSKGYETEFKMGKDGEFTGRVHPPEGTSSVSGTWKVENNSYCMNMYYQPSGSRSFCNSMYKLGERIYVGRQSPKPDSKMNQRFVKPM